VDTALKPLTASGKRRAVALVSVAHFFSHFYLLLLAPLFPVMAAHYGVGYTALGFALSSFSLLSGFTQAPMGFLVDRYGARRILIAGVAVEGLAFGLIGFLPGFGMLIALLGIAGIANSVYHPADYAILNEVVDDDKMGRAFSIHTFAGYVGEAVAPVSIIAIAALFDWRIALALCGAAGVVTAIALAMNGDVLDVASAPAEASETGSNKGMKLLLAAPIVLGLLFFAGISFINRGITGFGVSVLHLDQEVSLVMAGSVLSAWLFASPVGVLVGGWVADRTARHGVFAASCFAIMSAVIAAIAFFDLPVILIAVLFAVGGFFSGAVSPSRDMLIRSVTPPGQTGKVFGFVSTGFNIGGVLAPPLYGMLLDQVSPDSVFWVASAACLLTMTTVLFTGASSSKHNARSA